MLEQQIQREYVRTDSWSVTAKIGDEKDAIRWTEVKVPNVAAGGLLFLSENDYEPGKMLWFDLLIDPMTPGIAGKIPMKVKGEVGGFRGKRDDLNSYSVEFVEISKSDRIRLDELIRMTNFKYKLDSEGDLFDR